MEKNLTKRMMKIFLVFLGNSKDDIPFLNNSEERRKFIDMMISAIDKSYKESLKKYEKFKNERLKILKKWGYTDSQKWLAAVENNMASIGLVICDARRNFVKELNNNFDNLLLDFPILNLELKGELDRLLNEKPALEVEEIFMRELKINRKKIFIQEELILELIKQIC